MSEAGYNFAKLLTRTNTGGVGGYEDGTESQPMAAKYDAGRHAGGDQLATTVNEAISYMSLAMHTEPE
jgi:hypothetical protein